MYVYITVYAMYIYIVCKYTYIVYVNIYCTLLLSDSLSALQPSGTFFPSSCGLSLQHSTTCASQVSTIRSVLEGIGGYR